MNIEKYQDGYTYVYEQIQKGYDPQNIYYDFIDDYDDFSRGAIQCCLDNGAEE